MLLNKLILTAAGASGKKPLATQSPLILDKLWRGMETTSCVKHPNDAILFRQVIFQKQISHLTPVRLKF